MSAPRRRTRIVIAAGIAAAALIAASLARRASTAGGVDVAAVGRDAGSIEGVPAVAAGAALDRPDARGGTRSASPIAVERAASAIDDDADELALAVELVDASGRALEGASVTIVDASENDLDRSSTDAGGRARLALPRDSIPDGAALLVGAQCLATTPSSIAVRASEWPSQPLRLVAAPTGRVEVTFDVGDHALSGRGSVWLSADTDRCGRSLVRALHDDYVGRRLDRGTVVFPHVPLGLCFRVGSWDPALDFSDAELDGPRRPDEVVRVDVALREANVRITGRVLDHGRAPLGDWSASVTGIPVDYGESMGGDTDANGRFEGFVSTRHARRASATVVVLARRAGVLERVGSAAWPGLESAPRVDGYVTVDLGDVVVESTALVAAGRVLDADGEPTRHASLEIVPLDPRYHANWGRLPTELAADGAFEVGYESPPERFGLRATAWQRLPSAPVELERGARDLVLRLRHGVRATGRILVAGDVDPDSIEIDFDCIAPPESSEHRVRSWDQHEDGRFESSVLEPGRYSVRASCTGIELARREFDVPAATRAGETVALEPFDLRELAHAIPIRVVGRDGADVARGIAYDETNEDGSDAWIDRDGRATLCATTRAIDVVVAAPGYVTQRFDGVVRDSVLALEPAPRLRVRVPDLPPAPAGWHYEVELELDGEGRLVALSESAVERLDAAGSAALAAPCVGPFTVTASIRRTGTDETHVIAVLEEVAPDPAAAARGPEIGIAADPEAVRAALDPTVPRSQDGATRLDPFAIRE